jgi:hypothetical protein
MKPIVLPEYGRNIQNMLDVCLGIEDRAERTRCARSIVDAMSILFPAQGDQQAYRRKLWDHLAVMSNFQLDVDLPFELVKSDALAGSPEPVARQQNRIRRRVYGHHIETMIATATAMQPGEERDELILLLANHMKKTQCALNPEGVEDVKIFKDIYEMSDGAIHLDPADVRLHDYQIVAAPTSKKKRKK